MDSYKVKIYLQTLIYITLPYYLQSQGGGIRCPTACEIGFTCAMVRHGNGLPAPDCISMQEAILLNQALNGGPSGPGTGFSQPRPQHQQPFVPQTQQTFPQQQPGGSIPGVNFLGGGPPPERRGFEDRFRSFQNPQSFTPPGVGFPQQGPGFPQPGGGAWGQPSNVNGGMPGPFNPGMGVPQGFIDPVSGAPVNPGFGNTGFGGRVDGGQNSRTSHAGSALGRGQPGVINSVTNQGNAFSSSGGSFPECFGAFALCQTGSICRPIPVNKHSGGGVTYRCVPTQRSRSGTAWIGQNTAISLGMSELSVLGSQRAMNPGNAFNPQNIGRIRTPPRGGFISNSVWPNSNNTPVSSFNETNRRWNFWNTNNLNNSSLTMNAVELCTPCSEHLDCNGLFTYCIQKVPCSGTVCHVVTPA